MDVRGAARLVWGGGGGTYTEKFVDEGYDCATDEWLGPHIFGCVPRLLVGLVSRPL